MSVLFVWTATHWRVLTVSTQSWLIVTFTAWTTHHNGMCYCVPSTTFLHPRQPLSSKIFVSQFLSGHMTLAFSPIILYDWWRKVASSSLSVQVSLVFHRIEDCACAAFGGQHDRQQDCRRHLCACSNLLEFSPRCEVAMYLSCSHLAAISIYDEKFRQKLITVWMMW